MKKATAILVILCLSAVLFSACGDKETVVDGVTYINCKSCRGSAEINCPDCHATGSKTCSLCGGKKETICALCSGLGRQMCYVCTGTGRKRCVMCSGMGTRLEYDYFSGRLVTKVCYSCSGGYTTCYSCIGGYNICYSCTLGKVKCSCGDGKVSCPKKVECPDCEDGLVKKPA